VHTTAVRTGSAHELHRTRHEPCYESLLIMENVALKWRSCESSSVSRSPTTARGPGRFKSEQREFMPFGIFGALLFSTLKCTTSCKSGSWGGLSQH
jgi:hypothetical protein